MNKTGLCSVFRYWPTPSNQRRNCSKRSKYPSCCATSYGMVRFEGKVPEWLADNQPSFKSYHSKRPEAHHTWNKTEKNKWHRSHFPHWAATYNNMTKLRFKYQHQFKYMDETYSGSELSVIYYSRLQDTFGPDVHITRSYYTKSKS